MNSLWGGGGGGENHLEEVNINVFKLRNISKIPYYSPLESHKSKDLLGIGMDVDIIMSILVPVWNDAFSKFDTFSIYISVFSVVCKSSVKGVIEG